MEALISKKYELEMILANTPKSSKLFERYSKKLEKINQKIFEKTLDFGDKVPRSQGY